MPVGHYPFIDIAVHERIRERFARGEALALFSADLEEILWANGGGARLFGHRSIYEFMDDGARGHPAALRQVRGAAARALATGLEQPALMRPVSGFRRSAVQARISSFFLGDGTRAVLLSADASGNGAASETAGRIIDGLAEAGTHVAVLDETGAMPAASPSIAGLEIDPVLRRALVEDVGREKDRLVKRLIATARGRMPAAIARLSDNPPLHLLFVVETDFEEPLAEPEQADDAMTEPVPEPPVMPPEEDRATSRPPQVNAWQLEPGAQQEQQDADKAEPAPAAETDDGAGLEEPPAETDAGVAAGDAFVFDPRKRTTRFVWKMDAEGHFSELSPEFAEVVGPNAADIVGRRFEDVARVFGLDRDHAVATLLQRRDTWSGKTVMWPVQGTGLSVPVDLAALPTYTRDRTFSGFRGFGIVRAAEPADDPEAVGLSLTAPADHESPAREDATSSADDAGMPEEHAGPEEAESADTDAVEPDEHAAPDQDNASDPFRGEVPALRIVPPPERQDTDKVIHLEEHRPRAAREGLSTGEQAAFREIGKRLASTFGRREAEPESHSAESPSEAPDGPKAPAAATPAGASAGNSNEPDAPVKSGSSAPRLPASEMPSAFALPRTLGRAGLLDERLIDELPVALLVHAGERVLHVNPDFLSMTGYADVDALREAGGLGALFSAAHYTGDGSDALPGTMTLIRADGEERPVHARLQSIGWRDGRALMLSLVPAREERTEAPEAPTNTEADEHAAARTATLMVEVEELRSILETATDGVVILGEHGDIRSMNGSASALFDYDDAELRGQPFVKLFAHESQRAVMDYLNGLAEHGVASVLNDGREVIGREAGGGFLPLFMTIGRLSGSNGYCAVMRDITQWKRTEEDLRAAKRAAEAASSHKSEFLARVSHEIRTPLNAIIGFSDMMAEQRFGPIGNPRYLEYAHDIGRSGKHVLDIVNDLLDISKIEAGEMEVAFTAVALNDAIAETVSLMQPQANGQRVIIRTSLSSSVPEIVADERSIRQIALNVLSNSIRFTPSGGQIVVSTAYEANGSVALRIRDTGIGMTRSELEQAMKPFRQVTGATRHRGDGTGLGLPLTKAMVEANRAQFDIRSAPGEGTLVEIVFPSQRVLAD